METKKITRLAMFLAISIVLNIIESFFPFFNGLIPGFKLGLANIITLSVLYLYGFKDGLYIAILRVFLVGILRTGLFSTTFFFSLTGVICSIIVMYVFKKVNKFSIIGVSILGSIAHSSGQLLTAIVILKNTSMIYYLPFIIILAIPSGILVGILSKETIKYLNYKNKVENL